MSPPCPVIVMAKAPQAGLAKTRLIPALGAEGAAALAERLLRHTVQQTLTAAVGPVDLCCAPDAAHPAFRRLLAASALTASVQAEGELGRRMQRAFERWLPTAGRALMIGTDCPALDAAVLQQAAHALQQADAVFVPALDGGYALIGLRGSTPEPTLFSAMPWSTGSVMALTRQRLAAAGLRHVELPALADIDEPADLVHLPAGWPA
jgi:rSAM/selenodomain-associated transferase 1